MNTSKQQLSVNQMQVSNLAQLQQQFNNLEDQLRMKSKQQQQSAVQSSQQQQQQKLLQIETEIQKSYNFYTQMLKERKDYLINELNTIVQYAVLNHGQNLNKQLKLKGRSIYFILSWFLIWSIYFIFSWFIIWSILYNLTK